MKLQIIAGFHPCPSCGYPLNDGPGGCTACGKFCTLGWTCGGYAHGTIPIGNGQVCAPCYAAMQDRDPPPKK